MIKRRGFKISTPSTVTPKLFAPSLHSVDLERGIDKASVLLLPVRFRHICRYSHDLQRCFRYQASLIIIKRCVCMIDCPFMLHRLRRILPTCFLKHDGIWMCWQIRAMLFRVFHRLSACIAHLVRLNVTSQCDSAHVISLLTRSHHSSITYRPMSYRVRVIELCSHIPKRCAGNENLIAIRFPATTLCCHKTTTVTARGARALPCYSEQGRRQTLTRGEWLIQCKIALVSKNRACFISENCPRNV